MSIFRQPRPPENKRFHPRKGRFAVVSVLAAASLSSDISSAQHATATANDSAAASPNRLTYPQSYFDKYNVSDAADMLRLLPGVSALLAEEGVQGRGFGSGGERVLINGRRFPGKSTNITSNLQRIPAASVARVEIISGSTDDINVQSEGMLVNVVLISGVALEGSASWEGNFRFNDEGRKEVDGLLSYRGFASDNLSYSLGIERMVWAPASRQESRYGDRLRSEVYLYPDGNVMELRPQEGSREHDQWRYTGGITYDLATGGRIQLNGIYQVWAMQDTERTAYTTFGPRGRVEEVGVEVYRHDLDYNDPFSEYAQYEISGEYESDVGPGSLYVLGYANRDKWPEHSVRTRESQQGVEQLGFYSAEKKISEDIFRLTYTVPGGSSHSIEVGGEVASNSRQEDVQTSDTQIPTSEVEELRWEAFFTHRWARGAFSLDSTLNYESSEISTNFAFIPQRSLSYLKPRFDFRYRGRTDAQYRLLVERTVSQLEFANFVPRYNRVDSRLESGNPTIEPEKIWRYEFGYERRFPKSGLLEANIFYKDITDAIDRVPLCRLPNGAPTRGDACIPSDLGDIYSAEGNISEAEAFGVEVNASVRLGALGVPNAMLSARYQWQETDIDDPFARLANKLDPSHLPENRSIRDMRGYESEVEFRHDVTQWGLAYGFTYKRYGWDSINSDLYERRYHWIGPTLDAFVEKRLSSAVTLRFEVYNLIDQEKSIRLVYADNAVVNGVNGDVSRVERFTEDRDTRFALRLRGTF